MCRGETKILISDNINDSDEFIECEVLYDNNILRMGFVR